MAIFNTTLHCTKEAPADETQEDKAVIIGIVVLASALIGCSLALVALGRDFFIGKNPPVVLVSALVWVDFIGVFSTSVIVFHGLLEGSEWMRDSPQCGLQAFFTTAFGLSSGAVVTSMSLDRVAALYKPFFYKQHATPLLSRTICAFLTMFCLALAALPFFGIGKYKFNQSSRSFCQFDWFPVTLTETVNSLAIAVCGVTLITVMTVSNTTVLVIVVRIRRRMSAVLPSDMNSKRRARRFAFRQEERMAKFVALASVVFLFTWLPVTVRLFCNIFRAYPSTVMDNLSLRLVIFNFVLDPFTYVLFKKNFKRNLQRSLTELSEFLADVRLNKKVNRNVSFKEDDNKSALVFGTNGEMSVIENTRDRVEKTC
ncbi:prostaglandin D2 receptor [Pocillopora verrucosa]|uniref:prostaglandin D2 receptor n=1 Tax=Pocillopora verrucosa TaxID=203993 RepID=UPI00333E7A14